MIAAVATVLLLPALGVFSDVAFEAANAVLRLGP